MRVFQVVVMERGELESYIDMNQRVQYCIVFAARVAGLPVANWRGVRMILADPRPSTVTLLEKICLWLCE